jgi:hypothetical protein
MVIPSRRHRCTGAARSAHNGTGSGLLRHRKTLRGNLPAQPVKLQRLAPTGRDSLRLRKPPMTPMGLNLPLVERVDRELRFLCLACTLRSFPSKLPLTFVTNRANEAEDAGEDNKRRESETAPVIRCRLSANYDGDGTETKV